MSVPRVPKPPTPSTEIVTLSEETLRHFVATSHWIYAKTMPHAPHEYTLRKNAQNEALFEQFVMHIRHHGYRERYGKNWYIRLDLDEWKYWTMGAPLKSTILINRALHDAQASVRPPKAQQVLPFMNRKCKSPRRNAGR